MVRSVVRAAFIFVVLAVWGSTANALLITIYGDYTSLPGSSQIFYDASAARGTLTCSLGCEGLTSSLASGIYSKNVPQLDTADGWSGIQADLFYLDNNALASELAFINEFTEPDTTDANKVPTGDTTTFSFTSASTHLLFKIGASPDMFLIRNTSGEEQTYSYLGFSGMGSGLDHYTVTVSEPGSLGLLGTGLLAVGLMSRSRRNRRPDLSAPLS